MQYLKLLKKFLFHPVMAHLLFWGWNVIYFLSVLTLEINEGVFIRMVIDAFTGEMPFSIFLYGLLLFSMPLVSMIVAVRYFLDDDSKLLRWFVCIELPIMFLFFLRLVGFNEITWGNAHFIFIAVLGIITMLFYVMNESDFLSAKWKELKLIGLTSILLLIAYVCTLLFMVIFPLVSIFIVEFFKFEWLQDFFQWDDFGWFIIIGIFFVFSTILFVVYPFYAFAIYWQTFRKSFQHFKNQNATLTLITVAIAATVNIALFFALNYNQPQQYAFDLWERMEKEDFPLELKQETMQNEAKVKRGIMNAYLAQYRYAFDASDRPLDDLYDEAFGSEAVTNVASSIMLGLAFPFMYQGNMYQDEDEARELYGNLFDESLHIAEKDRIIKAINSTWDRSGVEAGILDINEQKVWVKEQNVTVNEHGNFATVEIHEVYQNQTFRQQEILYYFTLPDNAVFSGLWLSDNDSIEKKYDYNVAPRGAAQQVYKEEVRRRVDPSLLEQVGPNQYRLRAFPILPKTRDYNNDFDRNKEIEGPNFHLWLEYTVCELNRTRDAFWPTPKVLERRNVFANEDTKFFKNGKKIVEPDLANWVPYPLVKTKIGGKISEVSYNGENVVFRASNTPKMLAGTKINLLIDNSFSMQNRFDAIIDKIALFHGTFGKENVNITIGKKQITSLGKLKKEDFWGKKQAMEQLTQFADKQSSNATVFLTDRGSYELTVDALPAIKMGAPLYIYHLGKVAKAYPDNLYETVKMSEGDVCSRVSEIQDKIAFKQHSESNYIGRYTTFSSDGNVEMAFFESSKKPSILFPSPFAAKIIGAKLIDKKTKEVYTSNRLQALDEMHAIAKKQGIVSPYSSMIVLVNDAQKEALKKAEEKDDRFDRENETGGEPTGVLGLTNVTGTPEPHEWVLIILSALMLLVYYAKKNNWRILNAK